MDIIGVGLRPSLNESLSPFPCSDRERAFEPVIFEVQCYRCANRVIVLHIRSEKEAFRLRRQGGVWDSLHFASRAQPRKGKESCHRRK
ncbi:hypothetical protein NPIL_667551 [Nephila pilipes]|uniref:Uncharacterized protein n=1 Tax=Nephila pilipes TaxID=299642 RepID=A0A8X6NCY2_NEPPI|nr:hypothetical protein NPIL_667551 [Nephila pilipes]